MEHTEQKLTVEWFRLQYPRLTPLLFAIPNGAVLAGYDREKRGQHMAWLLAEGFATGLPDLFLAYPRGMYHGLFLEMKDRDRGPSSVTLEQRNYICALCSVGYAATWASGFEQAQQIITTYMKGGAVYNDFNLQNEKRA